MLFGSFDTEFGPLEVHVKRNLLGYEYNTPRFDDCYKIAISSPHDGSAKNDQIPFVINGIEYDVSMEMGYKGWMWCNYSNNRRHDTWVPTTAKANEILYKLCADITELVVKDKKALGDCEFEAYKQAHVHLANQIAQLQAVAETLMTFGRGWKYSG